MTRPTRSTDGEHSLRADADFRGINKDGEIHYLFGMACARLANANTEIERLEKLVAAQQSELEDLHG